MTFGTIVRGDDPEDIVQMASQAPRAWWDVRGQIGASEPLSPTSLDLTDLELVNRSAGRGRRRHSKRLKSGGLTPGAGKGA